MKNNDVKNEFLKIQKVSKSDFTVEICKVEGNVECTINNCERLAMYDFRANIFHKGVLVYYLSGTVNNGVYENEMPDDMFDGLFPWEIKESVSNALDEMLEKKLEKGHTLEELFGEQVFHQYMDEVIKRMCKIDYEGLIRYDRLLENFEKLYCVLYKGDYQDFLIFKRYKPDLIVEILKMPEFEKFHKKGIRVFECDGNFYTENLEHVTL